MKSESERTDLNSLLNYHIQLVHLLAMCTEGKNASTEIKCHSLIGLDDLVLIVTHPDCIPEVCITSIQASKLGHFLMARPNFDFKDISLTKKNFYTIELNHHFGNFPSSTGTV
jgi:hypothetical protein